MNYDLSVYRHSQDNSFGLLVSLDALMTILYMLFIQCLFSILLSYSSFSSPLFSYLFPPL